MIPRYSRPQYGRQIWSPRDPSSASGSRSKAHAANAMADLGVIPREKCRGCLEGQGMSEFDVARIDEIEAVTKMTSSPFPTTWPE